MLRKGASAIILFLTTTTAIRVFSTLQLSSTNPTAHVEQKLAPPLATQTPAVTTNDQSSDSSTNEDIEKRASSSLNAFQSDCFNQHNIVRSKEKRPLLTWSQPVASSAQVWANYLIAKNLFQHSHNQYGENLYLEINGDRSCRAAVNAWYAEKPNYHNEVIPQGNFQSYGHYTQLIWRNTKQVGCASASSGGKQITVCQYNPPGNYVGQRP